MPNDPPAPTKRMLVRNDDINTEVQDTKRQRIDLNADQKRRCLNAIATSFIYASTYVGADLDNLHHGAQIANMLKAIFTLNRQQKNGSGNLVSKHIDKPFTLSLNGVKKDIDRNPLSGNIVKIWAAFNLKFEKPRPNEKNHWWGTFLPLLTYCCSWESRLNELRIGHARFTKRKEEITTSSGSRERVEKEVQVSDFGLGPQHHIHLEGITFPPEVRASMAQTVGPMTAVIALCNEKGDSTFQKKYKEAVARMFSHVPNVSSMINALCGIDAAKASPLVRQMADLCSLVPARNQRRAFFPINFMAYYLLPQSHFLHYSVVWTAGEITKKPTHLHEDHGGRNFMEEGEASQSAPEKRKASPVPEEKTTKKGAKDKKKVETPPATTDPPAPTPDQVDDPDDMETDQRELQAKARVEAAKQKYTEKGLGSV